MLCAEVSDMLVAELTELPPVCVEQPAKYSDKIKMNIPDNVFMRSPLFESSFGFSRQEAKRTFVVDR